MHFRILMIQELFELFYYHQNLLNLNLYLILEITKTYRTLVLQFRINNKYLNSIYYSFLSLKLVSINFSMFMI
jgi:hypothetical protein